MNAQGHTGARHRGIRSRRWHQSSPPPASRRLTRPSASARGRSSSSSEATSRARTICVCARRPSGSGRRARGAELLFVGGSNWKSDEFDALAGRLESLGRPLGIVRSASEEDLWAAYRLARFTVFPSLLEGWSPRRGVARLRHAGDHVASRQHRRDRGRRRCLLVDPYDVAAIETAMDRLLDDDALLERLRTEARGRTSTWADYADSVGLLVTALRDTADATAPTARRARPPSRPESLLVVAARRRHPLLAPDPGWSFARAEGARGPWAAARRALWTTFRDRQIGDRSLSTGTRDCGSGSSSETTCMLVRQGSFDPNEFVLLSHVLKPGMVVVDGGAEGLYSLFAAQRVSAAGRVIAVEPLRELQRLLANLRLNEIENTTAARVALGASQGTVELAIAPEGHEGQNTVGPRVADPNLEAVAHETVEMITVDLVSREGLHRVDLIKLDLEGSEGGALEGARAVVERDRPLLLVEAEDERLASQGGTKAALVDAIVGLGYRLYVFDEITGQLRPHGCRMSRRATSLPRGPTGAPRCCSGALFRHSQ